MNKEELKLKEKFNKFWLTIYPIEKEEIKAFYKYIEYLKEKMVKITITKSEFKKIQNLFLRKHFDYLDELYSNILVGNYNSVACLLRIIVENYCSFYFIKKFQKQKIYNDWILWSTFKLKQLFNETPYQTKMAEVYKELQKQYKITSDFSSQSFAWLKRVLNLNNYSFKNVSKIISPNIYKDFSNLSNYIHNDDFITKTFSFFSQNELTRFIYIACNYTNEIIKIYDKRYLRNKNYIKLYTAALKAIDKNINCFSN